MLSLILQSRRFLPLLADAIFFCFLVLNGDVVLIGIYSTVITCALILEYLTSRTDAVRVAVGTHHDGKRLTTDNLRNYEDRHSELNFPGCKLQI